MHLELKADTGRSRSSTFTVTSFRPLAPLWPSSRNTPKNCLEECVLSKFSVVTNLKFADGYNRTPISNKKAIKLKSLSYDSCPSDPLKMIFQSILWEQNQLKLQNDFILKSIEATLCHEINNPLAIGLGKIHHMKRMPITYEAKEELDEIESSLNRIKSVIKKKLP